MDVYFLCRLIMVLQIGAAMLRDPAAAMEIVTGWRPHAKAPSAICPSTTEGQ